MITKGYRQSCLDCGVLNMINMINMITATSSRLKYDVCFEVVLFVGVNNDHVNLLLDICFNFVLLYLL